jgi:uncharacterized membrane protein YozB (DUF420 family)
MSELATSLAIGYCVTYFPLSVVFPATALINVVLALAVVALVHKASALSSNHKHIAEWGLALKDWESSCLPPLILAPPAGLPPGP